MIEEMLLDGKASNILGPQTIQCLHNVNYGECNGIVKLKCINGNSTKLNFEGGATSQYVACNVMSELDRQKAR